MSDNSGKCHVHIKAEAIDRENPDSCVHKSKDELKEFDGEHYCLFHLPEKNEKEIKEFNEIFLLRMAKGNYNFNYVWFPKKIFRNVGFSFCSFVYFRGATFLEGVDFHLVKFTKGVDFSFAKFFGKVKFYCSTFNEAANFNSATFEGNSEVTFEASSFENGENRYQGILNFQKADIAGYMSFEVSKGAVIKHSVEFSEVKAKNPEQISFKSIALRPRFFINVDSRKFVFTNVDWGKEFGSTKYTENEFKVLKEENQEHLLKIACRQLAENAEKNDRFEDASKFRQMAFDCERLERKERWKVWLCGETYCSHFFCWFWENKVRKFPYDLFPYNILHRGYRFLSSYGESPFRAFIFLLALVFIFFPFFYTLTSFQVSPKGIPLEVVVLTKCEITEEERKNNKPELVVESKKVCNPIEQRGLGFFNGEAILHSLTAVTFQDVEYRRPLSFCAELLTLLEKIFAPLQAALLALAIRRKFMW